ADPQRQHDRDEPGRRAPASGSVPVAAAVADLARTAPVRPAPVPAVPALAPGASRARPRPPGPGGWQHAPGPRGGKIGGHGVKLTARPGREGPVEPLVQLVQAQPALGVVLAQLRGHSLPFGVTDADIPFRGHLLLRARARADTDISQDISRTMETASGQP